MLFPESCRPCAIGCRTRGLGCAFQNLRGGRGGAGELVLVHLGGDVVVDAREVVAILDLARLGAAPDGKALIARAVGGAEAKAHGRTLIVTTRGLHLSSLAAETVARRVALPAEIRRRPTAEM